MHAPRPLVLWVACIGFALSMIAGSRPAAASPVPGAAAPVDSLYTLAGELYSTQRYVEAIPLFEQVLSLDPGFANAYALLGSSFLHLGVYEDAIANFENALRLDEGIKLAYLGLIAANYYTSRRRGRSEVGAQVHARPIAVREGPLDRAIREAVPAARDRLRDGASHLRRGVGLTREPAHGFAVSP